MNMIELIIDPQINILYIKTPSNSKSMRQDKKILNNVKIRSRGILI